MKADSGIQLVGSSVQAWQDQSGHFNHVTATGNQPVYVSSAINGREAIRFASAQSDFLTSNPIAAFNRDQFTWFLVFKVDSPIASHNLIRNNYTSGGAASFQVYGVRTRMAPDSPVVAGRSMVLRNSEIRSWRRNMK